jgi:hypothetical protein
MRLNIARNLLAVVLLAISISTTPDLLSADSAATPAPNSDLTYQKLRTIGLGTEGVQVSEFTLKRDAASFHLKSGTVCFVSPVEGKVTGAVFVGQGEFVLVPPIATESRSLSLLTHHADLHEVFERAVVFFTDDTYDEIKKAGTPAPANCDAGLLRETQHQLRTELHYNLAARILQDVLGTEPGGLFLAFIHGKNYSKKMVYSIDPRGGSPLILGIAPEEVQLATYDDNHVGIWAAFHLASEYKNHTASSAENHAVITIEHQALETTIERNGNLAGKASSTFVCRTNGLRVLPFDLYGALRVHTVNTEGGQPLAFIQEDKKEDPDFYVILPKPLFLNEKLTIITNYSGKEAVTRQGGDNYYPAVRLDWFPNHPNRDFGEFTTYDMTFRIPKGMKMVATGHMVSNKEAGDQDVSVWKSEVPIAAAGFVFGKFKREESKLSRPTYEIEAYANADVPDSVKSLLHSAEGDAFAPKFGYGLGQRPEVTLGTMSTTGMAKMALTEAEAALQLFSNYFGPTPFDRLAIAQQTAVNYGQSWPELVWLPMSYFYDSSIRHQLRMDDPRGYFYVVAPHEVAHQWWGHTVGFNSYRDQWMSEGFADMSASLYLQTVYNKEPERFRKFWSDERELLLEHNKEGFRAIDAGPLTQGYRLSNTRTGFDSHPAADLPQRRLRAPHDPHDDVGSARRRPQICGNDAGFRPLP